ncbi:hypothetical protein IWQ56_003865 [Coemansia nantahalensis]|nr:hypothetical protein IWQ56_003865 [Coemansia nantahalensis]
MKAAALEKYTVRDVLEYRGHPQLHRSVDSASDIESALALMNRHDIVSVPVFDAASESFVDIVSVYDIRDYIVRTAGLEDEVAHQLLSGRPSGKHTVLQDAVAQVVQSRKHASPAISAGAPLADLLRLFTTQRHHRVLVSGVDPRHLDAAQAAEVPTGSRKRGFSVDSGCSAASFGDDESGGRAAVCGLTQYDVVRFIQHHNHELGRALDAPVAAVARTHSATKDGALQCLTVRDTTLAALRLLRDTHCSALPVVDADGRLVTEVAGASLRRLSSGTLGLLGRPVLAYMFGLQLPVEGPYVVHDGFSVGQVMAGLLWTNCRRAWLVDRDERPVAVVSLTDILAHFM